MPALLKDVDPDGLLEYSVVYTDRAINHMSGKFQTVMRDIHTTLKEVYRADTVVVVPGSGTFGMEAVARQFATNKKTLVIRNGWFSFRWTQIFDMGHIPSSSTVLKAQQTGSGKHAPFQPPTLESVLARIDKEKPDLVFAPHVETSAGMMLPDDYIKAVCDAVHAYGGMFVLDCIASGTIWVDMEALGVDVLVSAPQKGWSGPPCAGLVMLSANATKALEDSVSTSFAIDLKKWHEIMQAYINGGHAYHATMPTDALTSFRDVMHETKTYGFDLVKSQQLELGQRIRALLDENGFDSVAAPGFEAPGVIVCYTDDPELKTGKKFAAQGMQIAAGVPLQCDEPEDFQTFRIGLFGIDKLKNVDRSVANFNDALQAVLGK
ncbi:MAG: aminotransferase class V-fold PLP-dependent enzyme [Gammaproteobacteria bacterium]